MLCSFSGPVQQKSLLGDSRFGTSLSACSQPPPHFPQLAIGRKGGDWWKGRQKGPCGASPSRLAQNRVAIITLLLLAIYHAPL